MSLVADEDHHLRKSAFDFPEASVFFMKSEKKFTNSILNINTFNPLF